MGDIKNLVTLLGVTDIKNGIGSIQGSVSGISRLSPRAIQAMELYKEVKKIHESNIENKDTTNNIKQDESDKK